MWVIFRDPKTVFNYLDKNVLELVADEDILTYQKQSRKIRAIDSVSIEFQAAVSFGFRFGLPEG